MFTSLSSCLNVNQFREIANSQSFCVSVSSDKLVLRTQRVLSSAAMKVLFHCELKILAVCFLFLFSLTTHSINAANSKRRKTVYQNTNHPNNIVQLAPEGSLRLVGGQARHQGNVQLYHVGRWGSICDDEWDMSEGNVACRQLGFERGAEKITDNSQFGKGRSKLEYICFSAQIYLFKPIC